MPAIPLTLDELRVVLREAAGADEEVDLDGDIIDVPFEELGYESLALLETAGRLENSYRIRIDEDALVEARTPRALIELVNTHLAAAGAGS